MPSFLVAWLQSELFFRQLALGLVGAGVLLWGWGHIHMLWTPFVVGCSLAYILNIPVTWASNNLKIPRWLAAGTCVGIFVLAATAGIMVSFPLIQHQLTQLALSLPGYAQLLALKVAPLVELLNNVVHLKQDWPQYVGDMGRELVQFLIMCVSNSMVLANIFTLVVLTPIVTFYSLKDWPEWMERGNRMLTSPFWRGLVHAIDTNIMAYLRGQSAVCGILMIMYTLGILCLGVDNAWKLGVLIGCSAFVPYGAVAIGLTSIAVTAFHQMGPLAPLLEIVIMVGFFGALEAYILIPNFIGKRLGVHPVGVLFCFLMCVSTLGFSGVFIAMPLLAALWGGTRFIYGSYYNPQCIELKNIPLSSPPNP